MSTQLGIWSYGAQVSQPIFTGGTLKGNLHLAESQYKQLLLAYQQAILEVLDGQRSLYSAELTLAQARGNEYQSLVQLYRSLGGGWKQ